MLGAGILALVLAAGASQDELLLELEGGSGPGAGKHVVLVAGDEEYRSEEALPMLARVLATHHGFRCTVLFSTDPETGEIDPTASTNQPGLERLGSADMLVLFTRFREWPDADMRHFADYVESGKPMLGIRTATHAFSYSRDPESPYARYDWRNETWPGGFGKQILGETWVNHHGAHGSQSTRGQIEPENAKHPLLRGVRDLWGPTDVYGIRALPADARVLVRGQVLEGMQPDSPPLEGAKNDPMMPVVWMRERALESGNSQRIVCSTLGASVDLECADLRRLFVNAVYWGVELEVPESAAVDVVGTYAPTTFGFGTYTKGVRAQDHAPAGD